MSTQPTQNENELKPCPRMDWQQVVLNGGPPCFFVEGPQYCGRAERWGGHGNPAFHNYVSLEQLLAARTFSSESEWQDIETAPKDGTLIFLATADYVCPGFWDRDPETENGQCWRDRIYDMDRLTPTHWMKLPEPPKETK